MDRPCGRLLIRSVFGTDDAEIVRGMILDWMAQQGFRPAYQAAVQGRRNWPDSRADHRQRARHAKGRHDLHADDPKRSFPCRDARPSDRRKPVAAALTQGPGIGRALFPASCSAFLRPTERPAFSPTMGLRCRLLQTVRNASSLQAKIKGVRTWLADIARRVIRAEKMDIYIMNIHRWVYIHEYLWFRYI